MSRVLVLLVSVSCLVRGDDYPKGDLTFKCKEVNDQIDQILANNNFQIERNGDDNMFVDDLGFDADINLYANGWKLPISVGLSLPGGNLTGLNTMKRADDVAECSTSITKTLQGIFEFGPELGLHYVNATAKFLFLEVEGKFVYRAKPRLQVALLQYTQRTPGCRFESIDTEGEVPSEYFFETEDTWKGRLISWLLIKGLNQKDETQLELQLDLWLQGAIINYFMKAWCSYL